MDALGQQLEQINRSLEELTLPSALIDCFEHQRRREMRKAAATFNDNELSWLLDLLNQLRGAADRQDDFDLIFDPMMYTEADAAWEAPPGCEVELPLLNSQLLEHEAVTSEFKQIADEEVTQFRTLADTFPDETLQGLARLAAAALLDSEPVISDRRSAIRYLALNASARLEDYWANDDTLWKMADTRKVQLSDLVSEQKDNLRRGQLVTVHGAVTEADLHCYTEEEIKHFAFNADEFLLSGKTRHMPLCGYCQERVAKWIEVAKDAEDRMLAQFDGRLPVA